MIIYALCLLLFFYAQPCTRYRELRITFSSIQLFLNIMFIEDFLLISEVFVCRQYWRHCDMVMLLYAHAFTYLPTKFNARYTKE